MKRYCGACFFNELKLYEPVNIENTVLNASGIRELCPNCHGAWFMKHEKTLEHVGHIIEKIETLIDYLGEEDVD
jgi:hypothetical protein